MTLSRVRRIRDPRRRAEAAAELLTHREKETKRELDTIRKIRDDAARTMLRTKVDGRYVYRPADVARTLGISRAYVAQKFPHAKDRT